MSAADPPALTSEVEAWIADDPEPVDQDELRDLLARSAADPDARADLAERFADRLHFGTAGLRAPVGAGPMRLNRAVVRGATAGLAGWLQRHVPDAARLGVVVGCDARHRSAELWEETARVLAGAGIAVHTLAPRQPTPLLAFATRHLGAAAGVMITASHNPAADNGYKLYLGDGAQIVPPVDAEIEAAIAGVGPLAAVPVAPAGDPLIRPVDGAVREAYLAAICAAAPAPAGAADLCIVHTAMHGVATELYDAAASRAGYPAAHHVTAQAEPDPDFPTVAFPNPEEPGALDLALAQARAVDADIVIANDPDGDRLAVAVADPSTGGGWRPLSGDELGSLLGAAILAGEIGAAGPPAGRVVASSLVSSSLLAAVAAHAGATWVETLTGFKWIVRAAEGVAGGRLVFGYEEALGYVVGDAVRDKDGLGTALAVLALAASDKAAGRPLLARLDELDRVHGVHATRQLTRRLPSAGEAATEVDRLRREPPAQLAGRPVLAVEDLAGGGRLPPADVIVVRLDGARVVVRPSGTEPKLKAYLEVVEPPDPDIDAARARAAGALDELEAALRERW